MSNPGRGYGRINPRGRGGRSGRSSGRGYDTSVDSRSDWEKLDKISIGTNLRVLKKACIANCRENWKTMMSVMETAEYVIMERPTRKKVIADLNAYAVGNFADVMGLEKVVYDDIHENDESDEDEEDFDEEMHGAAEGARNFADGDERKKEEEKSVHGGEEHGYSAKQITKLLDAELGEWMKFLRRFKQDKEGAYRDLWGKCNEDVKAVCKTKPKFKKVEKLQRFFGIVLDTLPRTQCWWVCGP